jgi:hypothetical protein
MRRAHALGFALLLASTATASEATPTVLDGAKLFHQPAIDRVSRLAADIHETFGIQMVIETAKAPPGLDPEKLRHMRSRAVIRALRDVAQDRAMELKVDGLYVLITTDPRHVTVVGWPANREEEWALSNYKREELRKELARNLVGDPDDALVHAVESYRALLGDRVHRSPLGTFRALAVVGVLLGVWLLLRFARRRAAGPERPLPIYPPAMLGSLFGVPAGFWIQDRLFQAERPLHPDALTRAPVPPPSEGITPGDEEGP